MSVFSVQQGNSPIVLGQPHGGTHVPDAIAARLNPNGQLLADTDWHINALYDGLLPGTTVVQSHIHRYVIDANRDPGGVSLYPGQNTTTLVPLTDFDGRDIWSEGQQPGPDEIAERRDRYHAPYHAALASELDRVHALHGFVILYDCHSIRSQIPFLFDGTLPDFNIGTNDGITCARDIQTRVANACTAPFTTVENARFKGGWTTRHYGQPDQNRHAIQMELAQSTYLAAEKPPWSLTPERLRPHLARILSALSNWTPT
ncbi:MAG: N-formylglutamate deformylase [Sedimentitalea sp.]